MTRGILIVGNESPLFSALCAEAAKRVETHAAALIPSSKTAEAQPDQNAADGRILLEWNSSSPISARTLVLSALNKMERIDDAVLVCVPPAYRKTAEDLSPAEIDRLIDSNIKGWFFLVRELSILFREKEQGMLSLVVPEINAGSKDDVPDLIGPAAVSVFRSFAQRVLLSSMNAPYSAMGFSSSDPGEESAFAAYIFKTMEEGRRNSGKWYKYGKLGIFGR